MVLKQQSQSNVEKKMASAPHRPRAERPAARFVRPTAQFAPFARPFCTRFIGFAALVPGAALANGIPMPGQFGFQEAATPIQHQIEIFHNWVLLPIISAICLLVLGLLTYVIFRFNEKANPTPRQTTHHSGLEVAWTVMPVMILVVIAIRRFAC